MDQTWLNDRGSLLTTHCPLPLDAPFTATQAYRWGVSRRAFAQMRAQGLVRRVLREVYAVAQAPDDTMMRAAAVGLVIPPAAVVTDRTAAWLYGVDILPRSAVAIAPPIDVVHMTDTRVRRPEADGRRRGLTPTDVTILYGIPVTTALRTALDLGRLLWRYDALAALDGFLRIGVPPDYLIAEIGRFRGYRGVRQLRALAPLADGRAESAGESGLRLHWHEAGLPRPELQFWIYSDDGEPIFRLDIADPDVRYCAEYDGEEFHTSEEDQLHDKERREWIEEHRAWSIDAFTKHDVYEPRSDPGSRLQAGHRRALMSVSPWTPRRRTP